MVNLYSLNEMVSTLSSAEFLPIFQKQTYLMNQKSFIFQPTLFIFLVFLLIITSCDSTSPLTPTVEEEEVEIPTPPVTTTPTSNSTIAFYNVENLFDTVDDPQNDGDNEFLPTAPKAWTMDRYEHKLNNIGLVMKGMGYPIIMGVSEVENKKVLEDLAKIESLKDYSYQVVHEESPDHRGIDVALLYQPEFFQVLETATYEVTIDDPQIQNYTTREILMVKGMVGNETLYVFVNHWPSRSGGEAKSEFRRITVAEVLKEKIEELQTMDSAAQVIIMGDFNDEPTNKSVQQVLGAKISKETTTTPNVLYNCTTSLTAQGAGSYNYQGNWQMIDQIITTGNLSSTDNAIQVTNFQVYKDDMLLFTHPDYGPTPDRTYGGDNYYGGFSDHLAIYVELVKK